MFIEIFPRSFRSKKVPKSKFSKTTLPLRSFVYKVNAFHIENDLTIPKSEIIVKSASIAVALNCELPTSVNLPNFF
jgi:hypothetical protein